MLFKTEGSSLCATHGLMRDGSCVYSVYSNKPGHTLPERPASPFYIGLCKLRDVYTCPDMRRWSRSMEITEQDIIMLTVNYIGDSVPELMNMRAALVKELRPVCNVSGYQMGNQRSVITCIEGPFAGQSFATQVEAVRRTGISQSAISNHLNHVPRFETVKGCKFVRGLTDE